MKKIIILLVVLTSAITSVSARQWVYISPNGNDQNSGTRELPLASLAGARDRVRRLRAQKLLNDTVYVYILPGNYYMIEPLKLGLEDSGTAQNPVVFSGDATNRPVFYGGMRLNKFEAVDANLWRVFSPEVAHYGFYFEQMFINGKRRFRAQTPNNGEFNRIRDVVETSIDPPEKPRSSGKYSGSPLASQKIMLYPKDAGLLDSLKNSDLDGALTVIYHQWTAWRKNIEYFNRNDTAFYVVGRGRPTWNPINNVMGGDVSISRYTVENFRGALNAPGEWFLSRDGYLYYIPFRGETVENMECMVPVTETYVVIEGDQATGKRVENIRFENLCFRVAGYRTPAHGNEASLLASPVEASIMLDYANHIEFLNCEVAHTGLNAIWFRRACSEGLVQHCHLHDLGAGAVKIGETRISSDTMVITNHITVDNNIIQHGGFVFPDAGAVIIFHGKDNIITHNDIADFRYTGITVGMVFGYAFSPSKRNKIEFNHIHHLGWGELSDMGGVYTLGQSEGTTVSNNLIHHVYSYDYGGWGLYNDEGSSYIVMENNLIYNCSNGAYMMNYGKEVIIRNNIFAFNIETQLQFGKEEKHESFSFTHNIVYFDKGSAFNSTWKSKALIKAVTEIDYNCYWDARTLPPDFHGMNFTAWQKLGKDQHSLLADPLFKDPRNLDFHLKSLKLAKKIGFVPFDYSKAGVYGEDGWKNLAKLDPELMRKFDEAVLKNGSKGKMSWNRN